jgi:hypothetical protein
VGVKWLGCDVDQARSSSTKVKNEQSYTFIPSVCLRGMGRDFTFTFTFTFAQ